MNYERIFDRIKAHEGVRLKPYRCTAGKLTIGVGRNLEDVGITEEEAERMLLTDVNRCEVEASKIFSNFRELSEIRQEVLIEMVFNLGAKGLRGFRNMIAKVEQEDFDGAADEMLNSRWAKQVGQRANALADLMRKGY
jgi:lysozyme